MKATEEICALRAGQRQSYTDAHIKALLDAFAGRFDNRMQNDLVSELMKRYADVSAQLEEKNRALAQSEASLHEAQRLASLGSWTWDCRTRSLRASDTICEVLEIDPEEGGPLDAYLARVHPEDREDAQTGVRFLSAGVATAALQRRLVMRDGRVKWVHIRSMPEYDAHGVPVLVRGTMQDITASKAAEEKLQLYNDRLEAMVRKKVAEASAAQMATLHALVKLAESRDDDTGDHIGRTSLYCRLLAEQLLQRGAYPQQLDEAFVENIMNASPLHDIGKVGIPDVILRKPGKLTPEEFEVMKRHVFIGYETLASAREQCATNDFIRVGMEISLCHHEKWDGSGYPSGLRGEAIPLSARIMALSDVYDALRAERVYKESFSHEKSKGIIAAGSGTHFEPLLVEIFLQNDHAFCEIYENSRAASLTLVEKG